MKINYYKLLLIAFSVLAVSACKSSKGVSKAKMAAKAYSPAGDWTYLITGIPDGDQEGTLSLTQTAEGLVGKLITDQGEVELEDLVLTDNVLTSTFSVQGYDVDMKGTFEGENFSGNVSVAGYEFPVKATRAMKK